MLHEHRIVDQAGECTVTGHGRISGLPIDQIFLDASTSRLRVQWVRFRGVELVGATEALRWPCPYRTTRCLWTVSSCCLRTSTNKSTVLLRAVGNFFCLGREAHHLDAALLSCVCGVLLDMQANQAAGACWFCKPRGYSCPNHLDGLYHLPYWLSWPCST